MWCRYVSGGKRDREWSGSKQSDMMKTTGPDGGDEAGLKMGVPHADRTGVSGSPPAVSVLSVCARRPVRPVIATARLNEPIRRDKVVAIDQAPSRAVPSCIAALAPTAACGS